MGQILAIEVAGAIRDSGVTRVSFVGHSMGGLIIRAALPHLTQYRDMMKTFISLSCPHLGYTKSESTIVGAALWLSNKLSKTTSLSQLTLQDSTDLRKTTLYRLASTPGLSWF